MLNISWPWHDPSTKGVHRGPVTIDHNRVLKATTAALAQLDVFEPTLQKVRDHVDPIHEAAERKKHDENEEQWRKRHEADGIRGWHSPSPFFYTSLTDWFSAMRFRLSPLNKLAGLACAPMTISYFDALLIAEIESGEFAKDADLRFLALPDVPKE